MTVTAGRYALVDFGREALLLDLSSGDLFELNETAALVWARSLDGAPADRVAQALVDRYGLPLAAAREDVARALTLEAEAAPMTDVEGPFLYERSPEGSDDGYLVSRDRTPLLRVSSDGAAIRPAGGTPATPRDLSACLQSVAPKLLGLRGHLVLHASAVLIGESVVGFSGKSGAGKTTIARALARAGAPLLSEDKLVLRVAGDRVEAAVDCERGISRWVAGAVADLAAGRPATCEGLDQATTGDARSVSAIGFLDPARRSGAAIASARLEPAHAAQALFRNTFHGSDRPDAWRRHLDLAAAAARRVPVYEITGPDGLAALEAAAQQVTRRGTLQTAMTAS